VQGGKPASAVVAVPAATIEAAVAGATLVANLTLNFAEMAHDPYVVVLNGPDDLAMVDADSPFYLATIMMFGHHRNCGTLTYALPLGEKLGAAGSSGRASSDGTLRLRVLPLHAAMGHHGMGDASPVELVAVNVEMY
jgi:tyrosinase